MALLLICGAYLQGGLDKAFDFQAALAEMSHFGLVPSVAWTLAIIAIEVGASLAILTGSGRWLGALVLAGFTFAATLIANRFWDAPPSSRVGIENAFFEHLGLVGAFLMIAQGDLHARLSTLKGKRDERRAQ